MKQKKQFVLRSLLVLFLVGVVGFFAYNVDIVEATQQEDNKAEQAKAMDPPTVSLEYQPAHFAKKGGEVTLFSRFQGYGSDADDINRILYSWCLDGKPIHSFIAGSGDELYFEGGKYTIRNQYGDLVGGEGVCNIEDIYDPEDYVRWEDGQEGGAESKARLDADFVNDPSSPVIQRKGEDLFVDRIASVDPSVKANADKIKNPQSQEDQDLRTKFYADYGLTGADPEFWHHKAFISYDNLNANNRESIFMTRTVDSSDDIDGDGMADAWELKYFGKYAGKTVTLQKPDIPAEFQNFLNVLPDALSQIVNQAFGERKVAIPAIDLNASGTQAYSAFVAAIAPDDDFDGDGFIWGENYGGCARDYDPELPDGVTKAVMDMEACWIQTPAIDEFRPGPISEAWQVGVPYAKSGAKEYKLDNGVLSNYEEYVYGTNPTEADSDSDGIPDGYDIAGMGQASFPLKIQKDDDYQVDMHLFGVTQRGSFAVGRAYADRAGFNNTPFRYWRTDHKDKVKVGGGLQLPTKLQYSPYPVTMLNVGSVSNSGAPALTVEAASASDDTPLNELFFAWYLDDILLPADKDESSGGDVGSFIGGIQQNSALKGGSEKPSGFGKNVLTIPVDYGKDVINKVKQDGGLGPCSVRKVGLDVIDNKSGKTSHAEINVPIGAQVKLNDKYAASVDQSLDELLEGYNIGDETIIDQFGKIITDNLNISDADKANEDKVAEAILNQNFRDPDAAQFFKPEVGYRTGDLVNVKAGLGLTEAELNKCAGVASGDGPGERNRKVQAFSDNLIYNWYFDDQLVEQLSGRGKVNATFAMALPGSDRRSESEESSHIVILEIVDSKTNQVFAREVKELRVVNPYFQFRVDGAEQIPVGSVREGLGGAMDYRVEPGAQVRIVAQPYHFREIPQGLDFKYTVKRNGEEVDDAQIPVSATYPKQVVYEFTVANDVEVYDEIEFEIAITDQSKAESSSNVKQTAAGVIRFSNSSDLIADESITGLSGAINRVIPSHYRETFTIVFMFGGFILLGMIAYVLYQGKQKQLNE